VTGARSLSDVLQDILRNVQDILPRPAMLATMGTSSLRAGAVRDVSQCMGAFAPCAGTVFTDT
jgi:hypothetical protein